MKLSLKCEKFILDHKKFLQILVAQFIITFALVFIFSTLYNTPRELILKRQIKNLEYQMNVIDKKADGVYFLLQTLEQKDSVINEFFNSHEGELKIITPKSVNDKLDNIENLLKYSNSRFQNVIKELTSSDAKLRHYPAIVPISKKDLQYISAGFGMRIHPIYRINEFHYGMDFVAKKERQYMQLLMALLVMLAIIRDLVTMLK